MKNRGITPRIPRVALLLALALSPITYHLKPAQAQPVRLRLPWVPQAQFAGYYVAQDKGFFKDMKVDVKLLHPGGNQQCLARSKVASTDLIVANLSDVLLYNDTTTRDTLVSVLQHAQHASIAIVASKPLASPKELAGKSIAYWYRGRCETAFAYVQSLGIEVDWVPTESHNSAPFLAGAVDATLAMEYNELYLLQLSGRHIQPEQVILLRETPYDIPADGLYAKASYLRDHPKEVQAVADAVRRGWEWLVPEANRAEGLRIVMANVARYGERTNPVIQRHMLATILDLQLLDGRRPMRLERPSYDRAVQLLQSLGLVRTPLPYETFVFVPKRQ